MVSVARYVGLRRAQETSYFSVWPFGGRESIFSKSHTKSFCGIRKVAHEPVAANAGEKVALRSYGGSRGLAP